MRASFAVLATAVAAVSAQQYGPISQISDGQIQNPTTPVTTYVGATSASAVPTSVKSTVVIPPIVSAPSSAIVGTGASSGAAIPTGPYSNGTTVATSVVASTSKAASSAASSKSASASASATGAASAQQVGSFGFAAAVAALFLA